jgi:hypothetical protein
MATLIIKIQEHHQDVDSQHKSVGFSILTAWDGELEIGDCLPGIEPLLLRVVREAIDSIFGQPIGVSEHSMQDANKQANRFMN